MSNADREHELAQLFASLHNDPTLHRRLVKAIARMVMEQERQRSRRKALRKMEG